MATPRIDMGGHSALVAVDPSLAATGVALMTNFVDLLLVRARLVQGPKSGTMAQRCDAVCDAVLAACPPPIDGAAVIIERPRINVVTRGGKADPDDLIKLAILVGALARTFTRAGCTVVMIEPHTWKGQVPKDITKERVDWALCPEEKQRIELPSAAGLAHNVYDAIGIALWGAGRY
jgi:hypothetical protein